VTRLNSGPDPENDGMDLEDLRPQYSFADLHEGAEFRKSLRVKKTQGREYVWEMTWTPDTAG
jgi:hypothetical protein